jgi:LacI family transcriptional regulator
MTVGIIIPDISNPYYGEIVRGIQDKAEEECYSVLIQNTDLRKDRIIRSIYDLRDKHADGVIFAGGVFHINKYKQQMKDLVSRVVVIGRCAEDFPAIRVDNVAAAVMAVEHMASLGFRDIAFVNGSTHSSTMVDRLKGFRTAMRQFRFPIPSDYLKEGLLTPEEGYNQLLALLSLERRPRAVILANDQMAFGAIKAIRESGLIIPDDIAVMGFDNVCLCSYFEPAITSVDIPRYKMGRAAMELLFDLIAERKTETNRWFPINLIPRESTTAQPG